MAAAPLQSAFGGPGAAALGGFAWVRGRRIGTGGRAHWVMDMASGRRCAVKCIDLGAGSGEAEQEVPRQEVKRWEELQHPNIARCFGHDITGGELHIYVECVASGSLAGFLKSFGPLEAEHMQRVTGGLLGGLQYLHTRAPPVVHGNLKGTNVLVSTRLEVKLTDYGAWTPGAAFLGAAGSASLPWAAPEVVQGRFDDGIAADIWGVGCLMIEMATVERPWGDETGLEDIKVSLLGKEGPVAPPMPHAVAGEARDMIAQCLQWDPAKRPSSSVLLWHPFLADDGA